ncbi:MAG TPA: MerR family transcriptional regulator [bacterium]|nr:MerR family transcriptional regulator [bacterium]
MKAMKDMRDIRDERDIRRYFKIADLAREIDRTQRTVKEWEKKGLIPKPQRDSRGWRVYTEKQLQDIIRLVKSHNYFVRLG